MSAHSSFDLGHVLPGSGSTAGGHIQAYLTDKVYIDGMMVD